jgi:nicotinate-nucleotide adenylyltransferase
MTRVALFGGSFNPPHLGHQALGLMVLEACPVDELWLVPTFRHVFDKELAPFEHRVAMCRRLIAPLGSRARVCEVEAELAAERSRTLDTLEELGRRHPGIELRLVIGADILQERHRWHRWDQVVALAPPLVFQRHGFPGGDLPAPPEVSSTEIRRRLAAGESALPLVPRSVMDYIAAQGLYGDRKDS